MIDYQVKRKEKDIFIGNIIIMTQMKYIQIQIRQQHFKRDKKLEDLLHRMHLTEKSIFISHEND